jgi:hypothetical protein
MISIQPIATTDRVKQILTKAFLGLKFDEESHSYTYNGIELVSATTFIKQFVHDFHEPVMIKKRMGKINRVRNEHSKERTYSYFQGRWANQRNASTEMGSRVHNYLVYNYPDFA